MIRQLAAILLFPFVALAQGGEPKMRIADAIYDFGTVDEGTKVEAAFTVENAGSAPLEVLRLQPACGCTAVVSEQPMVAPSSTGTIRVTFDTSGFSGLKQKTVRVYTNDPRQPSMVLTMRGTVQQPVSLFPTRAHFGEVKKGQAPEQTIQIVTRSAPAKVTEVSSRSEHIETTLFNRSIQIKVKNSAPIGPLRARVVLKTSSDRNPVLNIPVFARIVGDYEIRPQELSFGLLDGPLEKEVEQRVYLENTSDAPIPLLSAQSDSRNVSVDYRELKAGKRYEIVVKLLSGTVGSIRARVNLTFDHPDAAERQLFFPVHAIVSRKGE